MFQQHVAALIVAASCIVAGCGGSSTSNSNSGGSGGGSGTTTTTDMGTLTMPGTTYQYQLKNAATALVLGISGKSQVAGSSVIQTTNTASSDSMWHFIPNVYSSSEVNIEDMLTHQVLGFSASNPAKGQPSSGAASAGAQALQFSDTGTDDQNWQLYLLSDGNYLLKNHYSGLYLEVKDSNSSSSAEIMQGARSSTTEGCTCQEWMLVQTSTAAYPNPMTVTGTGKDVHDPYMLKDESGTYWLYGTHNTLAKSTDMATFTSAGSDISPAPSWWTSIYSPSSGSPDMWAPSLLYANGAYYQYYAMPVEPDTDGGEAVIALTTSSSPSGPWTDQGVIISSWSNSSTPSIDGFGFINTTAYNAIDPAPFIDATGNWWLVFGSWFDGTHIVQLDPSTGLLKTPGENTTAHQANVAYRYWGEEGPFIYPWSVNGTQYYYYFAPINACCSSTSPYRIVVGRSTSPTGPFLDRGGQDLMHDGGTILLSTHGNIVGPGGQSVFTDTVNGVAIPTLVYHFYDGNANGTATLGINRLGFTSDGWPYIQ